MNMLERAVLIQPVTPYFSCFKLTCRFNSCNEGDHQLTKIKIKSKKQKLSLKIL